MSNSRSNNGIVALYAARPYSKVNTLGSKDLFNVLALPVDESGCGWYRVRQIIQELNRQGLANTCILDGKESHEELARAIEIADVILCRNNASEFMRMIKIADPWKTVVFDHDDYMKALLPSNEAYKDFGVADIVVDTKEGPKPMWVSGSTQDYNRYKNIWRHKEMEYLLEAADLNTSPTDVLSQKWSEYNGNAATVPNYIDFDLYPNVEFKARDKGSEIRVGWHGGVSHFNDIASIAAPMKKLMLQHRDLIYYSVGAHYEVLYEGFEDRVRAYEWMPFKAHPLRMATLDLDIAVIPLQNANFNDYKSEVKFTEFAALGIPCVVVDRLPYNVFCKDGENCLTYRTEEEFEEKMNMLIKSKDLRKKLAKNAYEWAREGRDIAKGIKQVLKLYRDLANEKRAEHNTILKLLKK